LVPIYMFYLYVMPCQFIVCRNHDTVICNMLMLNDDFDNLTKLDIWTNNFLCFQKVLIWSVVISLLLDFTYSLRCTIYLFFLSTLHLVLPTCFYVLLNVIIQSKNCEKARGVLWATQSIRLFSDVAEIKFSRTRQTRRSKTETKTADFRDQEKQNNDRPLIFPTLDNGSCNGINVNYW